MGRRVRLCDGSALSIVAVLVVVPGRSTGWEGKAAEGVKPDGGGREILGETRPVRPSHSPADDFQSRWPAKSQRAALGAGGRVGRKGSGSGWGTETWAILAAYRGGIRERHGGLGSTRHPGGSIEKRLAGAIHRHGCGRSSGYATRALQFQHSISSPNKRRSNRSGRVSMASREREEPGPW